MNNVLIKNKSGLLIRVKKKTVAVQKRRKYLVCEKLTD